MVDLHLSVLVAELQSQFDILRKALAFLLGKRCHYGYQDLALGVHRVDGFLFKVNRNASVLELPDVFQAVQRVSGKAADRFCDYHVDFAVHAGVDHPVKFCSFLSVGAGDTVVGINARQHPVGIFLNVLCVVFHLSFIACSLLIAVCTDAAVRCDSELWLFILTGAGSPDLASGRNNHYISHYRSSLSIRV